MREDLDLNVPKTALSVSASSPPLSTSPHPSSFSFSPPNLPIISPTEIPSPSSLSPYDRSNDFHRSWARQSFELWKLTKYLLNSITYLKQDFSDPLFLVFVQTAEIHQKALLHHHTRRPYDPYTTGSPYDPTELSSFHLLVIAALQPPVFSTEVLTSASQHCSARQAKIEELHMCLLDAEDAVRRLEFRGAARSEVQQARRLIDTRRTALIELLGSTPLFPIVTTLGLPSTSSAHDLIALGSTDTKVDDSWHSAIGDQNKAAHLDDDTPALGGNGLSDQGPVTAGDADGDDALKAASAGKDAQDIPLGIPFIHGRICSLGSMDANYISSTAADTSSIGCQVEGVHASSAIDDDIPSELAVEDRTAAPSQDPSVSALFPIHCNIAASVSGLANSMVDFDSMDCSARTSATSVSTSVLADASTLHRSPCTRLPPEDTPTFRWADDTDTTLHAHALGTNPASAVAEDHPRYKQCSA
ncbi:hypothetical protein CF319_g8801 [Tilletia indica]|nr:hypothetical protein CF319_g8801 [Tilletia indica]